MKALLLLTLCFIFFISCTSEKPNTIVDHQNKDNNTKISCTQDTDCVLVSKDCCPCSSGGSYLAIHKSEKVDYENELRKKCSPFIGFCTAWYRCDDWEDKARCINNECSVIDK